MPFLVRSAMLGVLIAMFAGPFAIYMAGLANTFFGPDVPLTTQFGPAPSFSPSTTDIAIAVALILVGAPVVESLAFPLIYWSTRWLPAHKATFAVLIGAAAFFAHGAAVVNLAQAAGFVLMALWYAYLRERYPSPDLLSPRKIPYFGIVIAHFAWNATAILWSLGVGSLTILMSGM